jgi:2-phosphosulfolactate phosphatase
MIVDVIPSLKDLNPPKIYGKTVIVLDIFRCTSTIVTALANGCKEVIPARSVMEAREIASKYEPGTVVLAGEIKGAKIDDFDFGNSPLEFSQEAIRDKTVILSTTNGTEAIKSSKPAKNIIISSFLNVSAACSRAVTYHKDIIIVCSGTEGNISLEDLMAAGCHVSRLKQYYQDVRLSDQARTFYYLYKYFQENLLQVLQTSRSGLNLQNLGYEQDIPFCLQQNIYKLAPVFNNNSVQLQHANFVNVDVF